ncbi:MAG: hypothetical protein ACKOJF_23275, partial [Planctomycetaceae bacterium]
PDPGLDDGLSAVDPEPAPKRRSNRATASRPVASETDTEDAPASLNDSSDDRVVASPAATDDYTDFPLTPVSGTVAKKSAPPSPQGSKSPASASRSTRGKSPRAPAQR